MALLGGTGGRDSPAQTKQVTDLRCDMSGVELTPSASYNSTARLKSLAGFVPVSWWGGVLPPWMSLRGSYLVYRFLAFWPIPSGLQPVLSGLGHL